MKFFPKKLSLKWINQAYDNNELTPYELVDEILKRAEENKDKNIWIVAPSRELMEKYISKLPPRSEDKPLWGIPFAIKDNIDLEGVPTTAACPEYSYMPKKSAFVVQKLIDAGAFPVGKTKGEAAGLIEADVNSSIGLEVRSQLRPSRGRGFRPGGVSGESQALPLNPDQGEVRSRCA